MIKDYIDNKTGKKMYEIIGEYIGKRPNGKEKRVKKKGFTSKKAAKDYIFEAKKEFEKTTYSVYHTNITLKKFIEVYLDNKELVVKESTIFNYNNVIKLLDDNILNMPMKKITTPLIQVVLNKLSAKYSRQTFKTYKSNISAIFNAAVKQEVIIKNPISNTETPKKESAFTKKTREIETLNGEELAIFINAAKEMLRLEKLSYEYYMVVKFIAYTGMRKGEAIARKWNDLISETIELDINSTASVNKQGKLIINDTPKTDSSLRRISLDTETFEELMYFRRQQKVISMYIFRLSLYYTVNDIIKRILKFSGLKKKITAHGLRHTHTSILAEAGVPVKYAQKRLGHKDISITLNIYTHVNEKKNAVVGEDFARYVQG